MATNLDKLIKPGRQKTGEGHQTTCRHVLANGYGAHPAGDSVPGLLRALRASNCFAVLVKKLPAVAAGANPAVVN